MRVTAEAKELTRQRILDAAKALFQSAGFEATTTRDLSIVTADPAEASFQPLTWYAQHVYNAYAVIAHLVSPRRTGAQLHNLRISLAAGIAVVVSGAIGASSIV